MSTFDLGPVRALKPEERDDAPTVGLGEFWTATYNEAQKASNFDAHLYNYSNAFDGIADRVKAATGEALDNPFRSVGFGQSVELLGTFSREAVDASSPVTSWRQRVLELKAKHPGKLDWDSLIDEPGRVAFETMRKTREDADALSERAGMIAPRDVPLVGNVWGVNAAAALGANLVRHPQYTATQLLAGLAGQMTSPADAAVNLISFGVGGTAKSIIKNATLNALSNAAGQALLSGPKQLAYQSAGLPYGWQVWAEEVGAAAGAGFALDMGIRTPVRAAVNRFGRDTPAGTAFSRNTERGSFFLDAANDATPRSIKPLEIDAETIRKAEAGDIAASRTILEKTGYMQDPAVRYAVEHVEGGGRLTEDALALLEKEMGVARPDGMRMVADAMAGRLPEVLPEPMRPAAEPLVPDRGAELAGRLAEVEDQAARLPQRVREAVEDGLEAGLPSIVRAVDEALAGPREVIAERLAQAVDARTLAQSRLHGGRAGPVEMAQSMRQFPDLIDDTVPIDQGRLAMARSIARLDDGAFEAVTGGAVPPEVAAMVADRVPRSQQARMVGDLERARPQSIAEAADLIDTLTMPEKAGGSDLANGPRIVEPNGPEAKAHVEQMKNEAGQAYREAMAPIERRNALEQEIEDKRAQIAKLEEEASKAPPQAMQAGDVFVRPVDPFEPDAKALDGEAAPSPADQIGQLRAEIHNLDMELAAINREIDGEQLYRLAMGAIARRRMADIRTAVNQALALASEITPEGTRVEVMGEMRAPDGRAVDAAVDVETGHIQLSLMAVDPLATIGHEAVHTLVTRGHLSPEEVGQLAALAREAKTFSKEMEDAYREAYKGRTDLESRVAEEAAASYIEARIKGTVQGPVNTIVERIRQLLERIRQAMAGFGFKSREDVVQAILNGEAARRRPVQEWMRATPAEAEKTRAAMQRQMADGVELPDGTKVNGVKLYAIRAFHGSPHDFDRFSLDKIGTGEGAQAYGFGLYFAESEGVARSYRDKLSGKPQPTSQVAADSYRNAVLAKLNGNGGEIPPLPEMKSPGRLYEVSIKADPEDFLDWDKPLSQQSEKVASAVGKVLSLFPADRPIDAAQVTPSRIMDLAPRGYVEEAFRDYGVPGIKYLDQGSRVAGEGSRNYVVFDDSLIEIVAKDGQPVQGQKMFAFAGENARTADKEALAKAQEMETVGESRDTIWTKTGWFRGVDGRWRFEIDDSNAKWNWIKGAEAAETGDGLYGNLMSHRALFEAYPFMQFMKAAGDMDDPYGSYFDMTNQRVNVASVRPSDATMAALHEGQHVIQQFERMPMGGDGLGEYQRLAGEVEARAVEARAKLTPEERRARPPWEDYDVPEEMQIVGTDKLYSLRSDLDRGPSLRERLNAVSDKPRALQPVETLDLGFTTDDVARATYEAAKEKAVSIRSSFSPETRRFLLSHPTRYILSAIDFAENSNAATPAERAAVAEIKPRMAEIREMIAAERERERALKSLAADERAERLVKAAAQPRPIDPAMQVYHGTDGDFDRYSGDVARAKSDAAKDAGIDVMFVTPQREFASKFGTPRVLMLEPGFYFDPWNDRDLARLAPFINKQKDAAQIWSRLDDMEGNTWGILESANTLKELQRLGYDGVNMREEFYDAKDRKKVASTIAVFGKNKVFDRERGNMMFSLRSDLDMSPEREIPTESAVMIGGKSYRGATHYNALEAARLDLGDARFDELMDGPIDDGFVTNRGRFVSKEEAGDLIGVKKNGMLSSELLKLWQEEQDSPNLMYAIRGEDASQAETGRPISVRAYHGGTTKDWRTGEAYSALKSANGPYAGFFATDANVANRFAGGFTQDSGVFPVEINLQSPLVIDAQGRPARELQFDLSKPRLNWDGQGKTDAQGFSALFNWSQEFRDAVTNGNHDGVIIKNTADEGTIIIPTKPGTVRSATAGTQLYSIRGEDEPSLKSDLAVVDRMNRIAELIGACRA